ncbi:VOC family protein [Paenibacillus chondroitinus]|uniref:VOC family protein n=1 Tax=Paenibacillus chondroitinus TaxID=59842 RepID=A0ABU6DB79_9BACL|nr:MULTISPECIES: VOC family protein [Paenibacillus]MCY9662261.1 VOC family protein [Paenibacillus anseongense]MEB4794701.1 VOC family protein [Paenibacillus chondroitinus]
MSLWNKLNVDVITLFVEDLQQAKSFYQQVFGLPVFFEDQNSAEFQSGKMLINLLVETAAHELIEPQVVARRESGRPYLGDCAQMQSIQINQTTQNGNLFHDTKQDNEFVFVNT